jgi:hypothetical protein
MMAPAIINIKTMDHEDFFACVCALMGVEWVGAKLGWKLKGDMAR